MSLVASGSQLPSWFPSLFLLISPLWHLLFPSSMADYALMDPYTRSGYEHGIDAKIVVMGNTGSSPPLITRFFLCLASAITPHSHPTFPSIGVGKTSLLYRYTQNKFDPRNTTSTTGAFFVTKKVYVEGLKVRLQLWDTAGQERFRSMVCTWPSRFPLPLLTRPQSGPHVLSWSQCCSSLVRYNERLDI